MKEQVKVLINSKKEAKQVKAILKGLEEDVCHIKWFKLCVCILYDKFDKKWTLSPDHHIRFNDTKEISIRDLIILLTKQEEEKVFVMTSEDGVKLYVGSEFYNAEFRNGTWNLASWDGNRPFQFNEGYAEGSVLLTPDIDKAFSTKEAAEKWILEQNKPHQIEIKHNDSETSTVMKDKVFIECFDKGKLVQVVHLSKTAIEQITEAFNKINNQ